MSDFEQLEVWQRARRLVVAVYRATEALPPDERYGLRAQLRRAAVSVPSNIAEGAGRRSHRDFAHFVTVSSASLNELECQLLLTDDLGLVESAVVGRLGDEVGHVRRMLAGLRNSLGG